MSPKPSSHTFYAVTDQGDARIHGLSIPPPIFASHDSKVLDSPLFLPEREFLAHPASGMARQIVENVRVITAPLVRTDQ